MHALPHAIFLFLHVAAAVFWVGGMATMHFAVRPAAVATLPPPLRLPFMAAALARFLCGVDLALAVLWASGLAMVGALGGFAAAHGRVHAMAAMTLVMTAVYLAVRGRAFPALRRAVAGARWPEAGARLDTVRRLVAVNLTVGGAVLAVALVGRAF